MNQPQYLPSLLDRLEEGRRSFRAAPSGGLGLTEFKDLVVRDIAHLLNQPRFIFPLGNLARSGDRWPEDDSGRYQLVAESVLNYGLHLPFGTAVSDEMLEMVRNEIARCIGLFEPRATDVRVSLMPEDKEESANPGHKNALGRPVYVIEATIVADPFVERLYLRAELNLISGKCLVA